MRSLTLKLTLAFLIIGLLGALLVAFFVAEGTQRAFDQFVVDRDQSAVIAELAKSYSSDNDWSGAEAILARYFPARGRGERRAQPVVLVDRRGRVVVGGGRYPPGSVVARSLRNRGVPVVVEDATVGWLITANDGRRPSPGSPEGDFLGRVTQAIILSALGAVALALLLGIVLARTLTKPLRELTAATAMMASGALGQQVVVRSRDELGTLAHSFNLMSANLAQTSTARRQMTADIAHDLRTPLSVILGYTEALRDHKLPPDQEIFETLHIEAQQLQRLIDDLRTLSLADAGELSLMVEPTVPVALVERAISAHRAQAQAVGVNLVRECDTDLPLVEVDSERIAQVLNNLLSNALRFTLSGGTITLAAALRGSMVELSVHDTGSGIAPDDLPRVFERFYRADVARQQGNGSSGLGLAIAKGIVEGHGGSIRVESVVGTGTTFTISLPTVGVRGQGPGFRSQARFSGS